MLHKRRGPSSNSQPATVILSLVPSTGSCPELSGGLPWETARELQLVPNPRKEGEPSGMHCPDWLHIAQHPNSFL